MGPEAALADRIGEDTQTLLRLPDLIRRIEDRFPAKGGAPEPPPLPEIELMWEARKGAGRKVFGYVLAAGLGAAALAGAMSMGWLG